jgi:hypothetical protein
MAVRAHVSVKEIAKLYSTGRAFLSKHISRPSRSQGYLGTRPPEAVVDNYNPAPWASAILVGTRDLLLKSTISAAFERRVPIEWCTKPFRFKTRHGDVPPVVRIMQIARLSLGAVVQFANYALKNFRRN